MNNKLTNILLAAVLIIGSVGLIVGLQKQPEVNINVPETKFGFSGYNELGYSGMHQTTTNIGIEQADVTDADASTVAYAILPNNPGRMYAEIELHNPSEGREVRLFFGTTTHSGSGTTTYASTTKYWNVGKTFASSTPEKGLFIIGPDNLWQGEVWGVATTATVTIRTLEKY